MGTLHFLPNGSTLPPRMKPCREQMRDLACHGAGGEHALDCRPCGATVTLMCPRCGVHRCASCIVADDRCPMCLRLQPQKYALQEAAP